MKLYVVKSKDGKFFRPKGQSGYGDNWVELDRAKFYAKMGQAKSQVTFWFKNYPKYGCPDLLEFDFDVANAKVIDMVESTNQSVEKAKKAELKKEQRRKDWEIKRLKEQKEDIDRRLKRGGW
jgi:hypothetical protein